MTPQTTRIEVLRGAQLERITVDTTVQTKAVAHPTDSHLIVRAIECLNRIARRHTAPVRPAPFDPGTA